MKLGGYNNSYTGHFHQAKFYARSDVFRSKSVTSMLRSSLPCVKFPQENSSRLHQEVENCSTFKLTWRSIAGNSCGVGSELMDDQE